MGMQLPEWLRYPLEILGMDWPGTDEDLVRDWATRWRELARDPDGADPRTAVKRLRDYNEGPGVDAFTKHINESDSVLNRYEDFSKGCFAIAGACDVISGIVLALKIAVIAHLVSLALSIAGAIMSGGIGSAAVFAAKKIAKEAIQWAINEAVTEILAEE